MTGTFVQVPGDGAVFLDHVAHWVPDLAAAGTALERLGFRATPPTEHTHSPAPGAPREPAGSINRCVMLREGYLEVLAPSALETPISAEVRAALERYTGLHLAAFSSADAAGERERLLAAGFAQRPLVALERATDTTEGTPATLRFTVVRPERGLLPEGRVQFLAHHTPDLLWEPRWLDHPNGAERLTDLLFVVEDPAEAAARYARYLDRPSRPIEGGHEIALERGRLALLDRAALALALPGIEPPASPWMAGYALACANLDRARHVLDAARIGHRACGPDAIAAALPDAIGGLIVFTGPNGSAPWRRAGSARRAGDRPSR